MIKLGLRSAVAPLLVCLASVSCGQDGPTEPLTMSLEVSKHVVEDFQVSFTARIVNWDGQAQILYRAYSCPMSQSICVDVPFHEAVIVAETVTQPYTWTQDLCDVKLIFQASLASGELAEASHTTCS